MLEPLERVSFVLRIDTKHLHPELVKFPTIVLSSDLVSSAISLSDAKMWSCVCEWFKSGLVDAADMTLDEKLRYGMLALGGLSIVLAALGVHPMPLKPIGGAGSA